jgi:hypothetical protein
MENKPFIVLKLCSVVQAPKDENLKGFFANFILLIVLPEKNEIKKHEFKISLDSYHLLEQIDNIVNGIKNEIKDEKDIIKSIQDDVFNNVSEFPIQMKKDGDDYHWFLLKKMIEISENI